jgi:hypothetical protein
MGADRVQAWLAPVVVGTPLLKMHALQSGPDSVPVRESRPRRWSRLPPHTWILIAHPFEYYQRRRENATTASR